MKKNQLFIPEVNPEPCVEWPSCPGPCLARGYAGHGVSVSSSVPQWGCGGQRTVYSGQFSVFVMWVWELKTILQTWWQMSSIEANK